MNLIFLGPPGAGKGTQAKEVCKYFGLKHISTGDLLREVAKNGSLIGEKVKEFMNKGLLVPDEIVVEIVAQKIKEAKNGFVLDGFPRILTQAEFLDNSLSSINISLDKIFNFITSQEKVIERLSGRRICPKCNAIYHLKNMPPLKQGVCDKCNTFLIERDDDKEVAVRKRLNIYKQVSDPLIDYYKQKNVLCNVNGDLNVRPLFEIIKRILRG